MGQLKKLFFSYSQEDRDFFHRLMDSIDRDGRLALLTDMKIPPGSDYQKIIEERIELCEGVIAAVSPKYLISQQCRNELILAQSV